DCADWDDQLVALGHRQGEEAITGFAREGLERQPLAVGQLDLDMRLLGRMGCRVLLDLPVDSRDEVVQRRLGGARDPEIWAQKSFVSAVTAAPRCSRPSSVTMRPRGVRCRKPSWR